MPAPKLLDRSLRDRAQARALARLGQRAPGHAVPVAFSSKEQAEAFVTRNRAEGYTADILPGGTRNYVVNDEKLITIMRKYGLPPPLAVGAGYGMTQQDQQ